MFLRSFRAGTRSFARRSLCQPAPVHCLFPSKKRVSSGMTSRIILHLFTLTIIVFSTSRCCSQRNYATDVPSYPGSEASYSPEKLLQALEMMADSSESLPPIPSGQDQESFWRVYLLANQIIMYLAARPPTEAETFAAVSSEPLSILNVLKRW